MEKNRKLSARDLTPGQMIALEDAVFGIRKDRRGYYTDDDRNRRVDGRSLQALYARGLVAWSSVGEATQIIRIVATPEGDRLYEEELRHSYLLEKARERRTTRVW